MSAEFVIFAPLLGIVAVMLVGLGVAHFFDKGA